MRSVFQSKTATEAAVVCNLLVANGIAAHAPVRNSTFGGYGSDVYVLKDEDIAPARKLIRELYSHAPSEASWKCSQCSESNPSSFESCWQCNADRAA